METLKPLAFLAFIMLSGCATQYRHSGQRVISPNAANHTRPFRRLTWRRKSRDKRQGRLRFYQNLQARESKSTTTTLATHQSQPHCGARPMEDLSRTRRFERCRHSQGTMYNQSCSLAATPAIVPLAATPLLRQHSKQHDTLASLFRYAPRSGESRYQREHSMSWFRASPEPLITPHRPAQD